MGNWRTVQIIGSCTKEDIPKLRKALDPGEDYENFHCLVNGGIYGLPNWATEKINVSGNLAERDYGPESVKNQLLELLLIVPSLRVKIHCGDDYESLICIKTVEIIDKETVIIKDPEVKQLPKIPETQMNANLFSQITKGY